MKFVEILRVFGITDSNGNVITSTGGAIDVNIASGAIAVNVGVPDKTAFVYGTTLQETVGGVYQDAAAALVAGQSGAVRLTASRGFHVNLRDFAGNELVGQALAAASIPVVLASDDVIPVSGTFWQATQPVSGTFWQATQPISAAALPLPAGASTDALQTTGNTSLATLVANSPALGQALAAASIPVVLTAAQMTALTPLTTLPTGASTSALQTTGNTSLATLVANSPVLGQALAAASIPVVLTAAQVLALTPGPVAGSVGPSNAPIRNVYSITPVTTGAFVQLVASTTDVSNAVEVFDSSGQTLAFATGGAGSEVIQFYIFPGGNGRVPIVIAASTRISVKAISSSATSGELDINLWK